VGGSGIVVGKWICKLIYTVLAAFFDLYNNCRTRKTRFLGKMELIMKIAEKKIENVSEVENLVSEAVAAVRLGYSKDHLRKQVRYKGKISYVKYHRLVMYRVKDLNEYIQKHTVKAAV
jgi:hypothetical protein